MRKSGSARLNQITHSINRKESNISYSIKSVSPKHEYLDDHFKICSNQIIENEKKISPIKKARTIKIEPEVNLELTEDKLSNENSKAEIDIKNNDSNYKTAEI